MEPMETPQDTGYHVQPEGDWSTPYPITDPADPSYVEPATGVDPVPDGAPVTPPAVVDVDQAVTP